MVRRSFRYRPDHRYDLTPKQALTWLMENRCESRAHYLWYTDENLISGWPWGHGASSVGTLPAGSTFPCCGRKLRVDEPVCNYEDTQRCAACAALHIINTYTACTLGVNHPARRVA